MVEVLIRGEGIAVSCCLRLLHSAGVTAAVEPLHRPKLPAIMLGETTQRLLRDVFDRDDLFTGLPRICRRVVLWGSRSEAVTVPHSAVVASEKQLLERITQGCPPAENLKPDSPDWTIIASSPLPPSVVENHFGSRRAAASAVSLQAGCDPQSCWIESLEHGWLFLLPAEEGEGWLLSVGDSAESLLVTSRLIQKQICNLRPSRGTFPSHPRVAFPLCEPGWLACGSAAMGFDPLCGDGTGNAVREAILGSAAIRAAIAGGDVSSLTTHYQARLLAGFKRHIGLCLEFYKTGHSGTWWSRQLEDLQRGLSWCSQQLQGVDASRYCLNGFTLEQVD
jgi:hypothetical protein